MLDPALIRDRLDVVRERLAARGKRMDAELDALAALDAERRALIPKMEELKRQQNASGEDVARAKKAGQDASHLFAANKARGGEIKALEVELDGIETRLRAALLMIPNLPHETVPVGASAADNVEVRKWGTPPVFDFEPKSHVDLGVALGIVDFERATRMSGARFAILYGAGARHGAGPHRFHARPPHAGARLHRGGPAVPGERGVAPRHREPAEVRARPLQDRGRLGSLPHPDGGSAAHEPAPRGDPRRPDAAAVLHGLHARASGARPDRTAWT